MYIENYGPTIRQWNKKTYRMASKQSWYNKVPLSYLMEDSYIHNSSGRMIAQIKTDGYEGGVFVKEYLSDNLGEIVVPEFESIIDDHQDIRPFLFKTIVDLLPKDGYNHENFNEKLKKLVLSR
jgi:hypothetical protein